MLWKAAGFGRVEWVLFMAKTKQNLLYLFHLLSLSPFSLSLSHPQQFKVDFYIVYVRVNFKQAISKALTKCILHLLDNKYSHLRIETHILHSYDILYTYE